MNELTAVFLGGVAGAAVSAVVSYYYQKSIVAEIKKLGGYGGQAIANVKQAGKDLGKGL